MDPTYGVCAETSTGRPGYCTRGCATTTDCGGSFACAGAVGGPLLCERPPVGQGKACDSNSACAGGEATFCDTLYNHECLVEGCRLDPNDCFPGRRCCDFTKFGLAKNLCVAVESCP